MRFVILLLAIVSIVSCSDRCKPYKVQSVSILWANSNKYVIYLDSMYKVGDTIRQNINGEMGNTFVIIEKEGK